MVRLDLMPASALSSVVIPLINCTRQRLKRNMGHGSSQDDGEESAMGFLLERGCLLQSGSA